MWNNPMGFQLCYRLYVFERLITLLLSWRWSWLIGAVWAWQLIPKSGCRVIQWDIVLRLSLIFPGLPFRVFSPPGYPFFPKLPLQVFDFPGVQSFIYIPNFCPNPFRSEEHTSELQSRQYRVCRLLLEKICTPGKSKTWKGSLDKNGYPGGLKTRKGGPGKS